MAGIAAKPLLVAALFLGGCATVPRGAGFDDVRSLVGERTGHRVHWNQGSDADKEVAAGVRTLLAKELTADEAVQVALLNNQNLQATYEELTVAQADLVAAGLLRNPVFDAEVRFPEAGGGAGLELAVVQDFIDVLYIPLRRRLAGASFEAAKLRVAGGVMDLAGEVRAAFHSVQGAGQALEMRRQVLEATSAGYDLAKRLREAGNTSELDLANERALYEQSKFDVAAAEAELAQARERLTALMGLWGDDTRWKVAPRLPALPEETIPLGGLERRAVEASLDLGAARKEVERSAHALGIARPFGFFPEAEAGASAEREPDGEWAAGPAFSVPIPLFNQGQPAVASAAATLRAGRRRYAALAVELRSRVRAAHASVTAAHARARYYEAVILPLRRRILEQTQLQYNAMQVGAFQLLQAKQQQIEAGGRYVTALRDYWLARTELDLLLAGRMTSVRGANNESRPSAGEGSAGATSGGH